MRCLLILFMLFSSALVAFAGWVGLIGGGNANLTGVDMTSNNTVTVVGAGGTILRTTDDGFTWHAQTGIAAVDYNAVSFAGDNAGVVVGGLGTILRTTNGGTVWDTVQTDWLSTYFGAQMLSPTVGMIIGQNTLFAPLGARTTDGWLNKTDFTYYPVDNGAMTEAAARDVALLNDTTAVAVNWTWADEGAITRTTDGGENWTTTYWIETSYLTAIDFPTPEVGYAVGSRGVVLKSTDGGLNWEQAALLNVTLWSVKFVNADSGWVTGEFGRIMHTTNGGATWVTQHNPIQATLRSIDFVNDTLGYAVGDDGTIVKTADGGAASGENQAPGEFTRLTPEDSVEVIAHYPDPIIFTWSASSDPDGDPVAYRFQMWSEHYSHVWDTLTTETNLAAQISVLTLRTVVDFHWRVTATDGIDSTQATNGDGIFGFDIGEAVEQRPVVAQSYALASYPNPFNPATEIRFSLPQAGIASLIVYDVTGRVVATLAEGLLAAGEHHRTFNGAALPSGLYFARLSAGSYHTTQKLVLLK
jgi:photosystem II stability/assembly factor-like uncharacterized protein